MTTLPGQSKVTTQRKEADEPEILSGVFEGKTTGTPIAILIRIPDLRELARLDEFDRADIVAGFGRPFEPALVYGVINHVHPRIDNGGARQRWHGRCAATIESDGSQLRVT